MLILLSTLWATEARAQEAPPTGDLYATSALPAAVLWIDGQPRPEALPAMIRGLAPGPHRVEARTDCARDQATVEVVAGTIARAELAPVVGTAVLDLTGTPAGARVEVDGTEVGRLPARVEGLSCGPHQVAVSAPGHHPETHTLPMPAWMVTTFEVALDPERFGTLVLDVTPLETRVRLDGVDVGAGPRTLDHVAVGLREVEGEAPGRRTQLQRVEVLPDQVTRVQMALDLPPPVTPPPPRPPRGGPSAGRLVLDGLVTAVGLGAGAYGLVSYLEAGRAYDRYEAEDDPDDADRLWEDQVVPAQTRALAFGAVGAAGLVTGAVLWATTDF